MKYFKLIISNMLLWSSLAITAQPPIHSYELNNSYTDEYGGPVMVSNGGLLTSTSYEFELGEGPNVSNAIDPYTYSIVMKFTPYHTDYWAKVLDFKDRSTDNGIYISDGRLIFIATNFYVLADGVFNQYVPATVWLTRNGTSKVVRAYVDGIERWSFVDTDDEAGFTGPGNIIQILIDDQSQEHSDGELDYFRIYDYEVSPFIIDPSCGNSDSDCDGIGNICDTCPGGDDNGPCHSTTLPQLNTLPLNWLCSNNNNSEKILICHEGATLCVSENAAIMHLAHGDFLGPCTSCAQNLATPGSSNNFETEPGLELVHQVTLEEIDTRKRMKSNQFQVFPNPVSEEIHVELPELKQAGTLRILSLTGQEIRALHLSGQQSVNIDLSDYAAGIYLIDIRSAKGHYQKKIVKL